MTTAEEIAAAASSYEVLARLATGGMAEIFLARGASVAGIERYVVLKRILREKSADAQFVTMFLDEARLAALLQHPNIAQVYDVGRLGDSFFFTMEYVHGDTLRSVLQRTVELRRPVPLGCVLAIAAGAAAGLHHAHTRHGVDGSPLNIVHRDVSPSNLMISFEGNVKVVDFGVAKAAHRAQETRSGTVKGKIGYLSPEQCRGAEVDRRSDLFSLGIVLWETIAGARLFKRGSDFETMQSIVDDPMPSLVQRRGDVPPALEALVAKLLEKSPGARFQSAEELNDEIDQIAVAAGIAMSPSVVARLMRELFGQRREPWVQLGAGSPKPSVVTEAIGSQMIASVDPIEQALAQVIDLAGERFRPEDANLKPRATATVPASPNRYPTIKLDRRGDGMFVSSHVTVPSTPAMIVTTPHAAVAPPEPVPPSWTTPTPRPARSSRVRIAAVAIGMIAAGGIAFAALRSTDDAPSATPDAAPVVAAVMPAPPPPPTTAVHEPAGSSAPPTAAADLPSTPPAHRTPPPAITAVRCAREAALLAAQPDACVIAACRAHDAADARAWLRQAQHKRAVLDTCRSAGVALDARKPATNADCSDPFACQH